VSEDTHVGLQILSDLLISRGIKPSELSKEKRCKVCREYGPDLHESYTCTEAVCSELWGSLAREHWRPQEPPKKDIKEVFRDAPNALLDAFLRRNKP
jgi:hypothetical protein